MTPAQLDHLKLIDAHCAKRIAFYGQGQRFPAIPDCLTRDAESGWKATRAAINAMFESMPWSEDNFVGCYNFMASILAAFPLESLKIP